MISDSNRTTELWIKQPRRDGGRASGPSVGSAEGAALRRFGCERITPSWDALSSLLTFPTCQAGAEVCFAACKCVVRYYGLCAAFFGLMVVLSFLIRSRSLFNSHN